jgi:small-conductance mechanosensitive channel
VAADQQVVASGLTAGDWVVAGGVLVGGMVAGRLLQALLSRRIHGGDSDEDATDLVSRFAGYVIVVAGFVYALSILDVRLAPLLGALGIGGLAIAFAAQSIIANFIASVLLQLRRPFHRGDQIATNDVEGTVEDVNFRTVIVRSFDGERVFVPCSEVLDNPIVNFTAKGRRRTSLDIGVAYDADLDEARAVLLDAVTDVDGVLDRPRPEVWVEAFADSAVTLAVRFWHAPDAATLWRVRNEVAIACKRALDDAGIAIPFPQRVIRTP